MKIYHEETMELLESPDLELGRTYPGSRFVAHHDAVEEQSHLEVMPGTEAMNGGKGLRGKVIDVPASPAWDEYEDCLLYHPYTEEELAAMHPPDPVPTPDTAATWDELAAMHPPDPVPTPDTAATWDELAAAYTEGVASV